MTQPDMYDPPPAPDGQPGHLARVRSRLAAAILAFCADRLARGRPEFVLEELRGVVRMHVGAIAPDSPGRVLRDLRAAGRVAYRVVNRRQSRYRLEPPGPAAP